MATASSAAIPAHVPHDLVLPFPLVLGATTTEDPFERMIPDIHQWPAIFWSTNVYPGAGPAWVLRRAADLRAVYQDTTNFSSMHFAPFAKLIGESWFEVPVEADPPLHGMYRAVLNPLFAPKRMQALEAGVRASARSYAERLRDRGECELMQDFAFPFPVSVFLDLVGLPQARMAEFLAWERAMLHEPDMDKVADAVRNTVGYLREVIAERRDSPGDDFISYGIKVEMQGRKLTDDELVGYCFNLYLGGLDTVSTNIALQLRHLAEHPQDQLRLRQEPEFIPTALEELLRAYAAVTTFRTCVKETQIGGVTMKPGDKVAMSTTLACRDPAEYEEPNQVRLDRQPAHISFAYGPHRCIGSHLARREMQIALEEFLRAIPQFRIQRGARIVTHLGGIIQPETLPLVWK